MDRSRLASSNSIGLTFNYFQRIAYGCPTVPLKKTVAPAFNSLLLTSSLKSQRSSLADPLA
ncbi:hypothetical protein CY34DRAFT_798607 [Suillus luteus UH-Slu-Lm8-n1]|uniref:Uncharacterized protein n=1 Tax=Suillus luteus UH-Slu-Lm8-n1 TaxID=930992 RepID=A0A0D0ACU0_9AGAM|nr:hypothetical protein CY34DRAFT_798607 [Suillus luteus UH-Slu-Lm8-n1]